LAAKFGCEEIVKKLLAETSSQQVDACNEDGYTPLHLAAINGNLTVTQVLLAAGANKNAQASEKKRRWMPIHYAAQFGHVEIIKALINAGVDKEVKTGFGLTPLIVGAEFGHASVVQLMLSFNADKNVQTISDNHKMTALHYAVVGNFVDVAVLLLNAKINKEAEMTSGMTALEFAAKNSLAAMVVLLMSYGAGKVERALVVAQQNKSDDAVRKIKKYQKVKASLFNPAGLDNVSSNLLAAIKQFNADNLGEAKILLEDGVTFNAYGILSLTQQFGLFKKVTKTFAEFVEENGGGELNTNLKRLAAMVNLQK